MSGAPRKRRCRPAPSRGVVQTTDSGDASTGGELTAPIGRIRSRFTRLGTNPNGGRVEGPELRKQHADHALGATPAGASAVLRPKLTGVMMVHRGR